jgi:HPt (histidine-containing phosphotransfer) domain-containing protein
LNQNPIYDKDTLVSELNGNIHVIEKMVEVFQLDGPELVEEIQDAIKKQNSENLYHAAHKLKGMLQDFQAEKAANTAYEIEKRGQSQMYTDVSTIASTLDNEVRELIDVLIRDFGDNQ